jgi:ABC-type multidrug transport system ATPase subunit
MSDAIIADALTMRFGDFTAVDNVSFSVPPGNIFGFLGPNGSGKSTLIRMLCGLLRPASGHGYILGYDCVTQPEQVKQHIGYMSQKFSLYPDLTVAENIGFYGRVYGLGRRMPTRREEIIELLSLQPYINRRAAHLSGGWKQRLALGCALVHEPQVLFLDEPTAGIDPVARRDLWDFLFVLAGRGVTLFVTTHYMDEAERCNQLGYIYMGKLLVGGTPDMLKADPRVTPPGRRWLEGAIDNPASVMAGLIAHPHIDNVTVYGNTLHLRADSEVSDEEVRRYAGGITLYPGEPTLEDVFVMLTEEAEKESA